MMLQEGAEVVLKGFPLVLMFSTSPLSLQVNEHLRDVLVEEQKLREASFQESNATTNKVRTQKQDVLWISY